MRLMINLEMMINKKKIQHLELHLINIKIILILSLIIKNMIEIILKVKKQILILQVYQIKAILLMIKLKKKAFSRRIKFPKK